MGLLIVLAIVLATIAFRLGRAWGRAEVARWIAAEMRRQDAAIAPRGEFRSAGRGWEGGDPWPRSN